jgi:hypothetical protein
MPDWRTCTSLLREMVDSYMALWLSDHACDGCLWR